MPSPPGPLIPETGAHKLHTRLTGALEGMGSEADVILSHEEAMHGPQWFLAWEAPLIPVAWLLWDQ